MDVLIYLLVFAALFLALEVARKFERSRTRCHPSTFCEQSSCVRILRDPRPFDYEVDW